MHRHNGFGFFGQGGLDQGFVHIQGIRANIDKYRAGKLFPTRRLMPRTPPRLDNAHDLVYRDGYIFVTAQNDNQFGILKVNDARVLELVEKKMK